MKNTITSLLAIATALVFTSCNVTVKGIDGSGNVTMQKRELSGFTNIQVENGMTVNLNQGDDYEVTVEADDNVQPHIITRVENNTLIIESDKNSFSDVTMKINVRMPIIKGIHTEGGSSLHSKNVLRSDNVAIEADGGSSIDLNLEADVIGLSSSGGASVELLGKALTFTVSADSGSSIDAENLMANDVTADASSGASLQVHSAMNLTAHASSGASINYKGNPAKVTIDEGSGGSISRQQ